MAKDNVPVMYLEICDQGDSGFIMDGTENSSNPHQLRTPTVSWIPTEGITVYVDKDGIRRHKNIRHIKNCESIDPQEQEKMGFKPNRMNDKIPFDLAFANVKREGSTVGTFDYLKAATYFLNNELRPDSSTPLYREIKINERAVDVVDEDELLTTAKSKVYALRVNTGKEKQYRYDEDKINAYCRLLNVWDESPETKIVLLLAKASQSPYEFLQTITKAEQTVITEISHALQLGMIMFEGNTAQYTNENEVITTFGVGKMSEVKKIEALATYFQTPEGNNALTKFRTNLEVAKEKELSK